MLSHVFFILREKEVTQLHITSAYFKMTAYINIKWDIFTPLLGAVVITTYGRVMGIPNNSLT